MDCMMFHLLTVFPNNAAETKWYYISNGLKKPNRVPIVQLNAYLELLPCVYYSQCSNQFTKVVEPFIDPDLASHILRMCCMSW